MAVKIEIKEENNKVFCTIEVPPIKNGDSLTEYKYANHMVYDILIKKGYDIKKMLQGASLSSYNKKKNRKATWVFLLKPKKSLTTKEKKNIISTDIGATTAPTQPKVKVANITPTEKKQPNVRKKRKRRKTYKSTSTSS